MAQTHQQLNKKTNTTAAAASTTTPTTDSAAAATAATIISVVFGLGKFATLLHRCSQLLVRWLFGWLVASGWLWLLLAAWFVPMATHRV